MLWSSSIRHSPVGWGGDHPPYFTHLSVDHLDHASDFTYLSVDHLDHASYVTHLPVDVVIMLHTSHTFGWCSAHAPYVPHLRLMWCSCSIRPTPSVDVVLMLHTSHTCRLMWWSSSIPHSPVGWCGDHASYLTYLWVDAVIMLHTSHTCLLMWWSSSIPHSPIGWCSDHAPSLSVDVVLMLHTSHTCRLMWWYAPYVTHL